MPTFCGQCGEPAVAGAQHCIRCGARHAGVDGGHESDATLLRSELMAPPPWAPTAFGMPPEPAPQPRNLVPLFAIGTALVLVALAALGYIFLVRPPQQAQPVVTVSVTAARTSASRTTPAAAPSSTSAGPTTTATPANPSSSSVAPSYPALTLPGRACGTTGSGPFANVAAGNSLTSCEFAVAVQAAYVTAGGAGSPLSLSAFSPVTKKDYQMSCSGNQPVMCTGGSNNTIVVFLFGGPATFTG